MPSIIITPRTDESALSLATLRDALRITIAQANDALVRLWRAAAFRHAEHHTHRSLGAQVRELALDAFPAEGGIRLSDGPVTSITSVKYIDTVGAEITLASTQYTLDLHSDPQWLLPAVDVEWPDTREVANAVKVRYAAGAATLPEDAALAILLLVQHADANRGAVIGGNYIETPLGVAAMLDHLTDYTR